MEENKNILADLERSSKQVIHNIVLSTTTTISELYSLRGLLYNNPHFTKQDFYHYKNITASESYKYKTFYFIPKVMDDEREKWEKDNNIEIQCIDQNGGRKRCPTSDYYFPILYSYPTKPTRDVLMGYNVGPEEQIEDIDSVLRHSNQVTLFIGNPAVVNAFNLSEIILYTNLFKDKSGHASEYLTRSTKENMDNFVGFSSCTFSLGSIVRESLLDAGPVFYIYLSTDNGTLLNQPDGTNFKTLKEVYQSDLYNGLISYETTFYIQNIPIKMISYASIDFENQSRTSSPILVAIITGALMLIILLYFWEQKRKKDYINRIMKEKSLLLNKILPQEISKKLENGEDVVAERSNNAAVFFLDIAGFTRFSSFHSPEQVIQVLIKIFSTIDELCVKHNVEKIKTIGDAYMATVGVTPKSDNLKANTQIMLDFALDTLESVNKEVAPHLGLKFRIGIHCGPVISGVISGDSKPHFDVWGDTVNVASRMESTGFPNHIHVSDRVFQLTKDEYDFHEEAETIYVKGKGEMDTYFLLGKKSKRNGAVNPRLSDLIYLRKSIEVGSPHFHDFSPSLPRGVDYLDVDNTSPVKLKLAPGTKKYFGIDRSNIIPCDISNPQSKNSTFINKHILKTQKASPPINTSMVSPYMHSPHHQYQPSKLKYRTGNSGSGMGGDSSDKILRKSSPNLSPRISPLQLNEIGPPPNSPKDQCPLDPNFYQVQDYDKGYVKGYCKGEPKHNSKTCGHCKSLKEFEKTIIPSPAPIVPTTTTPTTVSMPSTPISTPMPTNNDNSIHDHTNINNNTNPESIIDLPPLSLSAPEIQTQTTVIPQTRGVQSNPTNLTLSTLHNSNHINMNNNNNNNNSKSPHTITGTGNQ